MHGIVVEFVRRTFAEERVEMYRPLILAIFGQANLPSRLVKAQRINDATL